MQRSHLRMADQLLGDRRISGESYEAALTYLKRYGGRIEEALLEVNALSEGDLLSYIASVYRTRYVTAEQLAKYDIDRGLLDRVARKVAERWIVVPVHFDGPSGILSIITADPHNVEMLDEVRIASGAKEVRPFVVRPAAAKAAFSKAYLGDAYAFSNIDRRAQEQMSILRDMYERNVVTEESISITLKGIGDRERTMSPDDFDSAQKTKKTTERVEANAALDDYIETLGVLVALIENGRADLRGHSARVARLVRKLGERIGIDSGEIHSLVIAALLHDLGKAGSYHLTPLNVAQYEGHRLAAEKACLLPGRLMERVRLPAPTVQALASMYERYDGKGLPGQRAGQDIPLGARILAIADSFADLTQNPRNPARRVLQPAEACEFLACLRGTLFDPNLFDLFRSTISDQDPRSHLLFDRSSALLIDSDPEETTVLELRLLEQGVDVKIARSAEQALDLLPSEGFDVVVSELDLPQGDGFWLLEEARQQPWGRDVPWVFLTKRQGRAEAQRAFSLGVMDYIVKPAVAELVVAKLKQALDRKQSAPVGRGVSGSLAEMSLPDLVQMLWHGRKTGMLRLRRGAESGELHFADGRIVNAAWGSRRGEEAFFGMLTLESGEFVLDPNFRPSAVHINASPEALLLEGMRRLDERRR